ncbi:Por secretion system C-terminal sorting domain-containing protein [Dyadobacter sp. SG02]|uniref:S8 family serine peptidase n=1 Tax=Dyadobacter sp. SG02 TaxID=1855291 RepID=UPI0008C9A9B0|nr:S8 family serine peptidase [Dyadobacter sp. SG02]SEI52735.1 Por secretion system C-terminal sorting domain-containing protein [Dyadobacter sp. SG02]
MISRKRTACLLLLLLCSFFKIIAQRSPGRQLFLKNRVLVLPQADADEIAASSGRTRLAGGQKSLVIIQFNKIPDRATQSRLKDDGIELLDYVPDHAYTATMAGAVDGNALRKLGVRAVFRPGPEDVVEPALLSGIVPDHARKVAGKTDVRLSFARSFSVEEVKRDLTQNGFEVIYEGLSAYQVVDVRIPDGSVRRLAGLPWVQYIAPVAPPSEMLNNKSTAGTKANVLGSTAILGYKLTGEGVTIGLGDDSNPILHPDIGKRVISYTSLGDNGWHGIHVGGTAAGSGLLNEKYRGYAPKSKVVFENRADIWTKAASLTRDYGMVVTSNTYGGYTYCDYMGIYMNGSAVLDQQAFEFPYLQQVFAAGNSGLETNCQGLGYPAGFGTVLGDFQSAKNILTVGRTQAAITIANLSSSKGPTADGRIKPEVVAPGSDIVSTVQNNGYQGGSGTSMATPAVTGGAALLYERYRQLHQQSNPKNALVKALICNGATDVGLPGPDFSHGFGMMNLLRSVTMLDKGHYFSGEMTDSGINTHQIVVPANTAKLKIMLYWNDPAMSMLAGQALVNNLDLSVTRPGNTKVLPKFPSAAAPLAAAVPGVDSVNNIEQVVLEEPAAGTYSIKVEASRIPQGVQEYFVVYDVIEPSLTVTYPLAGEHLTKGDAVNICWDSYGDTLSTFNVAYSLNNGTAWTTLNANVAADQRQLAWTVPDAATGTAKVRVIRNGTAFTNTSGSFAVLGIPAVTLQAAQCEGYIALQWNAIGGASDYEVMISTGGEMKSAGLTTGLKYTLQSLSKDSTYYVSVRARKDQAPGRRSVALIRKPDNGTCQGTISDNDLGIEAVVAPLPAVRAFTKSVYTTEQAITIRIKNLDDQPQTKPFEVGYSLGGAMHWEQVNITLPATASTDYTFQRRENLASVSDATLQVRVRLAGDPGQINDSLVVKLRQIPNPKLVLPYLLDLKSVPPQDIRVSTAGIAGADAFDFTIASGNSRLTTVVRPGYASQGGFVLAAISSPSSSLCYLDGTFNLSGYRVQDDEVWLRFRYPQGYFYQNVAPQIRGSGSDPWINVVVEEAYLLEDLIEGYKMAQVEITPLLRANGQEFTTDFQVRWNHQHPSGGVLFSDIQLLKASSDIVATKLEAPSLSLCDFPIVPPMKAVFKNNGTHDCYDVPVKISFDGDVFYRTIPRIKKDSEVDLDFIYPPNVQQEGKHVVKVWSEKAMDINLSNDTITAEFYITGTVAASPYRESFESGNGGWYTSGTNSSWEHGTPTSGGFPNVVSGYYAWKTNLTGHYNNNEESYLYSPCLDTRNLQTPVLSFVARMDIEQYNGEPCDMLYVEYNTGYGWYQLGMLQQGVNWYNLESNGQVFWQGKVADGWRVFSTELPHSEYLKLRFVFKSNGAGTAEGAVIDDINIADMLSSEIYYGATPPNEIAPVPTIYDAWSHFRLGNFIVASVNPQGQDIAGLTLQTFVNDGPLRVSENELVLDRNFVFNTAKTFEKPVIVRLYVPETDVGRLISAADQPNVTKPKSAYDLAITKYSGANQDGSLDNNAREGWEYFEPGKVKKVPYLNGYYLEFETKSFSEFWVARDYMGTGKPLPVTLINFVAEKGISGESAIVDLKWSTASETDFSHFVVQVATDAENVRKGIFQDLGTIAGQGGNGTRTYTFTDGPQHFNGTRYYRLKMVDHATDGSEGAIAYSSIRSVVFDQAMEWKVFPNPSKGVFRIERESGLGGPVRLSVFDLNGKLCKELEFRQATKKLEVDLGSPDLANGLYLIKVTSTEGEKQFKVVKE